MDILGVATLSTLGTLLLTGLGMTASLDTKASSVLKGKKICLDPGHGATAATDSFRQGPTGEREEWVNLRVALMLKEMLEKAGAEVIMTRVKDEDVSLRRRADIAIENQADIFVSIHHNGTDQDPAVNYPLIFFWKDANNNPASIDLAKLVLKHIQKNLGLPRGDVYSDFLVFPGTGTGVLRMTYPYMPGIIGEASFFTNPDEEQRLKQTAYNRKEAEAYFAALVEYFRNGLPTAELIEPKPGEKLPAENTRIRFKLNDGLGGTKMDEQSIRVIFNGEEIPFTFSMKDGVLTIETSKLRGGEQIVQLFAKNNNGQSIHPKLYYFQLEGPAAKPEKKLWVKTYEQGKALFDQVKSTKAKDKTDQAKLNEAIKLFGRSLQLFPNSPVSDKAQYYTAVAYEKMGDSFEYRKKAIEAYQRLLDYYPTSDFIPDAEKAVERLWK
ncbi:MAG: N-acetylmuramoyl-L-alanine amidase [bacterium]|nr:N-acetylmuramoyl-L-alanine amidase [bacterium]